MRLYTLLLAIKNRIIPISCGGTGAIDKNTAVANLKSALVDLIYPVGATYISVNSTSPATLFGGTWVQLKDRFLLGAGDTYSAGSTGGAATVTLTKDQMPSHKHTFTPSSVNTSTNGAHTHDINGGQNTGGSYSMVNSYGSTYSGYRTISNAAYYSGAHTHTITAAGSNSNAGGDGAHNNMPPYLTVYMWKRTA